MRDNRAKTIGLKQQFLNTLLEYLTQYNVQHLLNYNSPGIYDSDNKIINIRFDNVDGETLLLALDAKDICVSSGSACRSREAKPSHVLLTMGLTEDEARDSIRISFSHMQDREDIVYAAKTIAQCVATLRGDIQ